MRRIFRSLGVRLIFWVGLILLLSIGCWGYFHVRLQKERSLQSALHSIDRLSNTVILGTRHAMMLNARDSIAQMIGNMANEKEIQSIRIYNKQGRVSFSSVPADLGRVTTPDAAACLPCHRLAPPLPSAGLSERSRALDSEDGPRGLGVISAIYNEPACSSNTCHAHPQDNKVLGILDVVVSASQMEEEILDDRRDILGLTAILFLGTSVFIGLFLMKFVNEPIKKLILTTRGISRGEYNHLIDVDHSDEIGQLASAILKMRHEIAEKQETIKERQEEFQKLFEESPCYITVQGRDLKIIRFNRQFAETFLPTLGDYCYKAYKGREERCEVCPVIKTFEDGEPHYSEEKAVSKDGKETYWMVRTSPIRNAKGEIIAAMEMSLDLTHLRFWEREARKSEEKYRIIFNTIPNPVFVLDPDTLEILDCNDSAEAVYGFSKEDLQGSSFSILFEQTGREEYSRTVRSAGPVLDRTRQIRKDGKVIYVNMRISSSEYLGRKALLVTASDVTLKMLAEQQVIQASKMATLGEMATGVAHELNQPLSVIKTAGSFLKRKAEREEPIPKDILKTMAQEIDSHVDRASRIISHMREFGRKSGVAKERVQVNDVLRRAVDFFKQQLKLREIEVIEELKEDLPLILADANRLEQVVVNLLINARDAIEAKAAAPDPVIKNRRIVLASGEEGAMVTIRVSDTGKGIPPSIREKIFEPFFTTKEVGKGTGLGLSISYGIVRDYDGTIRVESKEGEGTSFVVQFPIRSEE
ncbi:MAG: ATP-binding protein [Thermodesulfobacteriota bacterium]